MMELVMNLWRKLTQTKALDQSGGKLETDFFESVYRVTYIVDRNIGYLLYSLIVKLMITLVVCGEIWYGFTEATNLDEMAATINVLLLQFIAAYRYKNVIDHKDFYKTLATSMDSPYFDISTKKRRILVDMWAKTNERNLRILLLLGNCTLTVCFPIVHMLAVLGLTSSIYEYRNIFPLLDELEYNLIINIRLPFCYATPIRYSVAYISLLISFWYVAHFVMITTLIIQAHLIHLLCQFSVLVDCFENLINDCSEGLEGIRKDDLIHNKKFVDKYTRRLGHLVQQHKLILRHTMHLRSILSGQMLAQLAASVTLICFIAYQTASTIRESVVKCLMSFLFLGYNIFELYIICHWCEGITNWSKKISEAVYFSGWEYGLCKIRGVKSTILFIMARANKPLVLTAGGMYDLSIASYGSLLKASYSALTVLLRSRRNDIN